MLNKELWRLLRETADPLQQKAIVSIAADRKAAAFYYTLIKNQSEQNRELLDVITGYKPDPLGYDWKKEYELIRREEADYKDLFRTPDGIRQGRLLELAAVCRYMEDLEELDRIFDYTPEEQDPDTRVFNKALWKKMREAENEEQRKALVREAADHITAAEYYYMIRTDDGSGELPAMDMAAGVGRPEKPESLSYPEIIEDEEDLSLYPEEVPEEDVSYPEEQSQEELLQSVKELNAVLKAAASSKKEEKKAPVTEQRTPGVYKRLFPDMTKPAARIVKDPLQRIFMKLGGDQKAHERMQGIEEILFLSEKDVLFNSLEVSADISEAQNGSVTAGLFEKQVRIAPEPAYHIQAPQTLGALLSYSYDHRNIRPQMLKNVDMGVLDTSPVVSTASLFSGCEYLETVYLSSWDTGNVRDMTAMFSGCVKLKAIYCSVWKMVNVQSCREMFLKCESLESLDLSRWNTGSLADGRKMFMNCQKMKSLKLPEGFGKKMANMSFMFSSCTALSDLDVRKISTVNALSMAGMFGMCRSLVNLDLEHFDVSRVKDMAGMFWGCENLKSLQLSHWNTAAVTDMSHMFRNCRNLTSLDLSGWDVKKVTSMDSMFRDDLQLGVLDASGWEISGVRDMRQMFCNCRRIRVRGMEKWEPDKDVKDEEIFKECPDDLASARLWQHLKTRQTLREELAVLKAHAEAKHPDYDPDYAAASHKLHILESGLQAKEVRLSQLGPLAFGERKKLTEEIRQAKLKVQAKRKDVQTREKNLREELRNKLKLLGERKQKNEDWIKYYSK